ncbi:type II toxin-antitoxin system VapC family toxin [Bosea sp. PAMC 26642]|uniref:type II toxin-antitoxin system VapC family toxin n=1 Tax=Bosea sp. (strain PAMC 26642) TaxID=1792307 RepID=UPI00077067C2|nr:PIN domain-containing protein [Bosea sp. PAMC 26642]AMJ61287.1 DNA-binding protein [Bosea sp. PAMC 26642]
MTTTLVDSNVFLDLITNDPDWGGWSTGRLRMAMKTGRLAIVDVVYAELSVGFDDVETLDAMLADFKVAIGSISKPALFMAGKAFARYRAAGGLRTGVLPDFFIGAQAVELGLPLLTRDAKRYRTYFPSIVLITP